MTLPPRDQAMIDAIGRVLVDEVDQLKRAIEKLEKRIATWWRSCRRRIRTRAVRHE
jgi:hypothetical protein